jgi:ATP-dependent RNA helicase DHX29
VYLVDGGLLTLSSEEKATLNRHRVSHMRRKDFYQIPERYGGTVSDDLLLSLIAMSFYPRILTREGRGYRNVYMNQHVSLRRESVNHSSARPPKWLSFSEAMQTKTGNLNVFETSRIPDVALACLLGDAEIKMFSGVVSIDNGKIKLAVRYWRQAFVLKRVTKGVREMLDRRYTRPDEPWREADRLWIGVLAAMTQS